jgi:hypothetical protein
MRMGDAVLHVNNTDYAIPRDDRGGEEGFKGIFRQVPEVLEAGILVSLAGDSQEAPFAGYPARQAFVELQSNGANGRGMGHIGSTENEFFSIHQVNETGIALHVLHDETDDSLQEFLETHLSYHEPADSLEESELLFRAQEARLKILRLRHPCIIPENYYSRKG